MTVAAEPFARVTTAIRKLSTGELGYVVQERYTHEHRILREFPVDWRNIVIDTRTGKPVGASAEADAFAHAYNAEHHNRVGLLVTASGYRDIDMKLHYVTADDGSDHVTVACGKSVINRDGGRSIEDAAENGLLDTYGLYRCCKKCWRSPAMKQEVERVCRAA